MTTQTRFDETAHLFVIFAIFYRIHIKALLHRAIVSELVEMKLACLPILVGWDFGTFSFHSVFVEGGAEISKHIINACLGEPGRNRGFQMSKIRVEQFAWSGNHESQFLCLQNENHHLLV